MSVGTSQERLVRSEIKVVMLEVVTGLSNKGLEVKFCETTEVVLQGGSKSDPVSKPLVLPSSSKALELSLSMGLARR